MSRLLQLPDAFYNPESWWMMALLVVWSLFFTGLALWYSARRNQKGWFILFLLVHTAGMLELIYLIFVARVFSKTEVKPAGASRR